MYVIGQAKRNTLQSRGIQRMLPLPHSAGRCRALPSAPSTTHADLSCLQLQRSFLCLTSGLFPLPLVRQRLQLHLLGKLQALLLQQLVSRSLQLLSSSLQLPPGTHVLLQEHWLPPLMMCPCCKGVRPFIRDTSSLHSSSSPQRLMICSSKLSSVSSNMSTGSSRIRSAMRSTIMMQEGQSSCHQGGKPSAPLDLQPWCIAWLLPQASHLLQQVQ